MVINRFLFAFALAGLVAPAGCATSTGGPDADTGCPPGHTRIEDEHSGTFDCASRQDMEDIGDVLDEHKR